MADITMCANAKDGCKWAKQCARFTATPSEFMQSWQDFYKEGEHCLHFILRVGRK